MSFVFVIQMQINDLNKLYFNNINSRICSLVSEYQKVWAYNQLSSCGGRVLNSHLELWYTSSMIV